MEFNKKLQELRKRNGLTQEELSELLFVSRTAVSKWESGKGYPSIASLKAISKLFSVKIDDLLSGDEIISLAEEESLKKEKHICNLVFGLLDTSVIMLFFLPFFAERTEGFIREVSLLSVSEISKWLLVLYYILIIVTVLTGILTLAFQNSSNSFWLRCKTKISLAEGILGTLLFMISLQPYAATFLFVFLIIKIFMLIKFP